MTPRLLIAVALVGPLAVVEPTAAQAKGPAIVDYHSCTTLHLHYRGGVARPKAVDHRKGGGHAKYKPYVNAALYQANIAMDRDHDGIACEQ
jgi:hypothetical protein